MQETKSVPNRVAPLPDEAIGRSLVVVWFELVEDRGDAVHVTPCEVPI